MLVKRLRHDTFLLTLYFNDWDALSITNIELGIFPPLQQGKTFVFINEFNISLVTDP